MNKKIIFFFLIFTSVLMLNAISIRQLQETHNFIEMEISLNDLNVLESDGFSVIQLQGTQQNDVSDSPDIPFIRLLFAVPYNGSIQAQIQEQNRRTINLNSSLRPVQRANPEDPIYPDYHIDTHKYSLSSNLLEIQPKGHLSVYDVVPVVINPITYNHQQKMISFSETIILRVYITGDFPRNISEYPNHENNLYSNLITNSKYGLNFFQNRDKNFNSSGFHRSHSWYRIEVNSSGMHVLDQQFFNILPLSAIDPRDIRIFSTGGGMMSPIIDFEGMKFEEIPLHIVTATEGSLGLQDRIFFYAQDRDGFGKNLPNARWRYEHLDGGSPFDLTIGDFRYINPFSKTGVYWFTWSSSSDFDGPPKRMQTQNIQNHSITRNTGRVYSHHQNPRVQKEQWGIEWYTQMFQNRGNTPTSYQFNVNVQDFDPSLPQRFYSVVAAAGSSGIPHRLQVNINNNSAINNSWTNNEIIRLNATGNYLQEGANNVVFTTSGNTVSQYMMFFNIEYHRRLDKRSGDISFSANRDDFGLDVRYNFTNPNNQSLTVYQINAFNEAYILNINNNGFVANSDLNTQLFIMANTDYLRPSSFAQAQTVTLDLNPTPHDALIIYPNEFIEGARRLREIYRDHYGYEVLMVSLDSVFDNFNGGHPDPVAIRNYLQYLHFNAKRPGLDEPPLGAVFLGSGTIDHRNFSGTANDKNRFLVNQMDPTLINLGINTVVTSDDFYGMMTGGTSSNNFSEIILGRIPAQNNQELDLYLNKLVEYLTNRDAGWWQYTFQMLADDEHYRNAAVDFIHTRQAEDLSDLIERNVIVDKLYAIEYELNPEKRKPNVREILTNKINEGRLYWHFIGHGSIRNMGDEHYFNADYLTLLRNRGKYPVMVAASCNVGQYELPGINSLAEELIFMRNAGSIISIGATGKSGIAPNGILFRAFYELGINQKQNPGAALMNSKHLASGERRTRLFYNVLGDPFLRLSYPEISNNLNFFPHADSLQIRQTAQLQGHFDKAINSDIVQSIVYDNGRNFILRTLDGRNIGAIPPGELENPPFPAHRYNVPIFNGPSSFNNSTYNLNFIVPEGAFNGNKGQIISMAIDRTSDPVKTYINRKTDIHFSSESLPVLPSEKPIIEMYIDRENFLAGDTVSPNPTLYADITTENGINTAPGYGMMVYLEGSTETINVSSGFVYELDSFTRGKLTWQLSGLDAGRHDLYLIVTDSFVERTAENTWFVTSETQDISINDVLVYPNPMNDRTGGYFTFNLSDEANVTISIFTITGRRIQTIRDVIASPGYNQIPWDGRDADGHRIANGNYFYTIRASSLIGRGSNEVTERLIILR